MCFTHIELSMCGLFGWLNPCVIMLIVTKVFKYDLLVLLFIYPEI